MASSTLSKCSNMSSTIDIQPYLESFEPISLSKMESVKLMNRIDTKYVVPLSVLPHILSKAVDDYFIQEIDGVRLFTYDTMYYDTDDLDMYIRHHDRRLVRQKIRVREYVDSDLCFLEIKKKNNKGRTKKKRITIPRATNLTGDIIGHGKKDYTIAQFVEAKSRYRWDQIAPKLRTRFHRITLVNRAMTERLTIDIDLSWENQTTENIVSLPRMVIIELKRDGQVPSPMLHIMLEERIRPLKVSKYCIGTALTSPSVKQNRFKAKIRKIYKILNTMQ